MKHNKAWRAALKGERGIAAEAIEAKIMEAWGHPNTLNADVEKAKMAFQRSYLLFVSSMESDNALLRELSMTEGQRAFDCSDHLHTKLALEPEVARDRAWQESKRHPRGSRMPQLDNWLLRQMQKGNKTNDALWAALPGSDTSDLYRDGERVVEVDRYGKERSTSRKGFDNRVTAARKAPTPVSN